MITISAFFPKRATDKISRIILSNTLESFLVTLVIHVTTWNVLEAKKLIALVPLNIESAGTNEIEDFLFNGQ